MNLLERLSARRATFYFVERDGIAYEGARELIASLARNFRAGDPFADLPDVRPVWQGSYLPFQTAFDRWAMPEVWAVTVGCATAEARRALVAQVRDRSPLGMFDLDADSDNIDLPLSLTGFLLPDAYIRLAGGRRAFDRRTGLDIIGPPTEEEAHALELSLAFDGEVFAGAFESALLRMLSRSTGRRLTQVSATDGYEALVNQAFELFHLDAVGAAGAVAGVAFERLMQAALVDPDREWLAARQDAGVHTKLNDVVAKVASKRDLDDARLRRYQRLRNDLAHRLGDDQEFTREEDDVREAVEGMLRWLDRQDVGDDGHAVLMGVDEEPDLSFAELLAEARAAGNAAATAARTTPMTISGDTFEPIGFAWVTVGDGRRRFSKWLVENGHAEPTETGAKILAPDRSFERNLAWAAAFARRLRQAGVSVHYAGAPD